MAHKTECRNVQMRLIATLIVSLMVFLPLVSIANQQSEAAQAIMDATRDANNVNVDVWGWAGGIFSVLGILIAAIHTPTVPPERLLGKSSEYVVHYTSTYREIVKGKQTTQATIGCVAGAVVAVVFYVLATDTQ